MNATTINQRPCTFDDLTVQVEANVEVDAASDRREIEVLRNFHVVENSPYWCVNCDHEWDDMTEALAHLRAAEVAR
jgi:hypothetical protein